jgi:hypothetical protein
MRHGLVLVAGLAVAGGCTNDGGTGPAADYSLALAPAALTIAQGANAPTTVTITRTNFTGAVTLSLGNAPAGVTGSFIPAASTGTSATLAVRVGAAVTPGVYNLTVNGTGTAGNRSAPLTLTVADYTVSIVGGDAQTGSVVRTLGAALAVRVTDPQGNAVSGVRVVWVVTEGSTATLT